MIVACRHAHERHQIEAAAACELYLHGLEADARMLHVIEDEFGAGFAANRGIAWREELERHGSERAAAGREPAFQWIWTQRISPGLDVLMRSRKGEDGEGLLRT